MPDLLSRIPEFYKENSRLRLSCPIFTNNDFFLSQFWLHFHVIVNKSPNGTWPVYVCM